MNTKEINKVYMGTEAVSKIMLGTVQVYPIEVPPTPTGSNIIMYTTTNEDIIEPHNITGWTGNIVSNTYVDGQGMIVFDADITTVPRGAFFMKGRLKTIVLPDSVTIIEEGAFQFCTRLESVSMSSNVRSIEKQAFGVCSYLRTIDFPSTLESIGEGAFNHCESLTSVILPDSVTSVGASAYTECASLTEIELPASLSCTTIGRGAFDNCPNLSKITSHITSDTRLRYKIFSKSSSSGTLYYPKGSNYYTWIYDRTDPSGTGYGLPSDWKKVGI